MLAAMKIAFLGLGRMGAGMAHNLLRAGHDVTVFNRTREKAEPLAAAGARVANSPAEACRGVEAAMTIVGDDQALEQVVFGKDGVAEGLLPGSVHISHSTISVPMARKLAAKHAERNQGYLSAPVFGRPSAAENKTLLVAAAGPEAEVERCRPLFEAVARRLFVLGTEPWQANVAKVCMNFIVISMIEAIGEAYATLRKSGIAPEDFLEIMNELLASQQIMAGYSRLIAKEQFIPAGFLLPLGLKDVRLVLQAADECAAPMPMASLVHDQLLSALAHGQEEMDWSSVALVSARNAGLKAKA